ncbi:acyl--CoA ligase [Candidatus Microgenomates bacterium]|nr:acyl--CoA ligase [Candidatus Microgenomates bacterium]
MLTNKPENSLGFSSVEELLLKNSQRFPNKEAIIYYNVETQESVKLTYLELLKTVRQTALLLSSLGIKEKDRFAILMENSLEILLVELAGCLIGATAVPLDFKRDTLERKIYKIRQTEAKVLFVKLAGKVEENLEVENLKKTTFDLKIVCWNNFSEFQEIIERFDEKKVLGFGNKDLSHVYIILYTSGTTSHPKGVILTTASCLLNAQGIALWQKFSPEDRFFVVLPLHHINSTIFCLSLILTGGTIILTSRYSKSRFFKLVNQFKATNTSIVPTILHDLLPEDLSQPITLKRLCIGSAPVLPDEAHRFYQKFKVRVIQGYGQTETALRVSGVPVGLPEKEYVKILQKNSIGTQLTNNEVAILDKKNEAKKENEEGEICIKGPILAKGYLNDSVTTHNSFIGDWFHSGDLGKYELINGKKYFYVIGRIKEIIIKGGVNISPSVIEDWLLKTFPEVDQACVVGFFDERMGEEIAAVIVPKKNLTQQQKEQLPEKIIKRAKNRSSFDLSAYEMPKKVFIFDTLPKTSTGKIQRVEVKKTINSHLTGGDRLFVRLIKPEEQAILKQAVKINNERFGLQSLQNDFVKRARNGYILGCFNSQGVLLGSLCCLPTNYQQALKYKTYQSASGNGTFNNAVKNADTLLCLAISVVSNKTSAAYEKTPDGIYQKLLKIAPEEIEKYANNGQDHVLSFHQKAKGGLPGAKVLKILPNSRPEDKEAMGYNVIMAYPTISKDTKLIINDTASPSVALIEKALQLAQESGIKHVLAFSRPVGFRKYLEEIQQKI